MDLIKSWRDGPLVDNACPNEECPEHMITVRYPGTMERVTHAGVTHSYFDIPMRCRACGTLYPPTHESQLEEPLSPIVRMRDKSGKVISVDPLVVFLYTLARDEVTTGVIDDLIDNHGIAHKAFFTNGWLAKWAEDAAARLRGETPSSDDPAMIRNVLE